jgi:hypothetical protein
MPLRPLWFMCTMSIHVVMCKKQNDMGPSVGIGYQMDQPFFRFDGYATRF